MVRKLVALATALALSACASGPIPVQPLQPKGVNVTHTIAPSSRLLENEFHQVVDSDQSIVYFQNFGGGGVAVGLLLGPIGMVANAKMIESNTKQDAAQLNGKIAVKPRSLFETAARANGMALGEAPLAQSKITPYLFISKTDEERLLLAAAVKVEQQKDSGTWNGKYMYQLPGSYKLADLASLDAAKTAQLQAAAQQGFEALVKHMQAEKQEQFSAEKPITIKSDFITPRFTIPQMGTLIADNGDMVWVRSMVGVYGLRKENVSVEPH